MTIGAILLAAGTGSRMGTNKLLANLAGKPLVRHAADALGAAGLPFVAVTADAEADAALAPTAAGRVSVEGSSPAMGLSIARGVAALPPEWTAVLICLGDMPFVRPQTLRQIADAADENRIVVPFRDGRRGNPLAWGRSFWDQLRLLREDEGARKLLSSLSEHILRMDVEDPGILHDIDTPQELDAAEAMLRLSAYGADAPRAC